MVTTFVPKYPENQNRYLNGYLTDWFSGGSTNSYKLKFLLRKFRLSGGIFFLNAKWAKKTVMYANKKKIRRKNCIVPVTRQGNGSSKKISVCLSVPRSN